MIRVADLQVELGGATVLQEVSLSVEPGEFLALVGPNGAGKTTLLWTVNGRLEPARGTVELDGREVAGLSARETARLVATVPQETAVDFAFTAEEFVLMGRTPHRGRFATVTPEDREAVQRALERTETAALAERSVTSLSGGERQRVVLARALAQETPALLLDEPTANLDINHQVRTLSLARTFADEGTTVVAAIHDLDLAARFCDTMVLLADGRVRAAGPPATVLESGTIEGAFDTRVAVGTNSVTGTPTVTPLADAPGGGERVHVVGRGEGAARAIGRLAAAGFEVRVGVLPEGDAAAGTARAVATTVVTAPPFEAVDEATRRRAVAAREEAGVTVLASRVSEPNRTLAAGAETLLALEGTDPPAGATVVGPEELVAAVRARVGTGATVSTD
ncbi:heme ABC transporter ATP-binding protein [Halobacteriales archaeon SW_10_68_16]|nr:MAG: heme ABC transporter ATP-binding protein [Halobacteriales archaeon SW_10_68_16]